MALKLNLSSLSEWPEEDAKAAKGLLLSYSHLFHRNDLDLGKTSLVKHSIKLTDKTLSKEMHRRIVPHLYHELEGHLQAIRKSFSSWKSPILLVRKKWFAKILYISVES